MEKKKYLLQNLDWMAVLIYILCVLMGWFNIYAAVYTPDVEMSITDMSNNAGKQLTWIGSSVILIIIILVIDHKFYETFSYVIYGIVVVALIAVLFLGTNINGSHSWFKIGAFSLQPAEFAKLATSLALSKYLSDPTISLTRSWKEYRYIVLLIGVPVILILLSNETGSALVFASFIIMLYREGLPGTILVIGLAMLAVFLITLFISKWIVVAALGILGIIVFFLMPRMARRRGGGLATIVVSIGLMLVTLGGDFFINNVLQSHQSRRIKVLVDPESDPRGDGWNVIQSKIAIGSGRLFGKGFLDGTQTKFDFVPEQSTDFIFCTVGEEHGFVGSVIVVFLFIALISRIVILAERQRSRFTRVYGYCLAGIFFFHVLINIGMTIGLMPVIGVPLPFFSYGGSSLWSFSILLFVFLKLDSQRPWTLSRAADNVG